MPRPRKPVATHRLEGTFRAYRHTGRREITADGDLAVEAPPAHLSATEQAVWTEVCRAAPPRLWKSADWFLVEAFVVAVAAHREATAMRARMELLIPVQRSDRPGVMVNPLAGEIRRQARLIAELGAQLGMTPEARLRLLDGADGESATTNREFLETFGPLRIIRGGRS